MPNCAAFGIIYNRRGVAQLGSALGSGPRGRGFESRRLDQIAVFCEILRDFAQKSGFFFTASAWITPAEAVFSLFLGSFLGSNGG